MAQGAPVDPGGSLVCGRDGVSDGTGDGACRGARLRPRPHGWDVAESGLQGGPAVRVIVGGKRHVTIDRALRLLGIGTAQVEILPVDDQGRMVVDTLGPALRGKRSTDDRVRSGR